jgi:hypothetical protein
LKPRIKGIPTQSYKGRQGAMQARTHKKIQSVSQRPGLENLLPLEKKRNKTNLHPAGCVDLNKNNIIY